jgi:D-alanyl-D-alanine dipeptidase
MTGFFRDLQNLRERPIPDLSAARETRKAYRSYPIDAHNPHYGEPLVAIVDYGIEGENYYYRDDAPPYYSKAPGAIPHLLLRESVARRLQQVDARLRACGLQLHVHDGYRPIEVQEYFFRTWMPQRVRQRFPAATEEQVLEETRRYWAQPTISAESPAPHNTGSAIDLTIRHVPTGEHLHMGSIFDDVTRIAHTDWFESASVSSNESYSDQEARANRRLLYWLMIEAGFVNYPNEWWHYSWGDQMWACFTNRDAALYGPAQHRATS